MWFEQYLKFHIWKRLKIKLMVVKGEVNTKNTDCRDMKKHEETIVLLSKFNI